MRVEGSSEQEDGQVDNRLYGLQVCTDILYAQYFNAQKTDKRINRQLEGQIYDRQDINKDK